MFGGGGEAAGLAVAGIACDACNGLPPLVNNTSTALEKDKVCYRKSHNKFVKYKFNIINIIINYY